jgi:membrane-bound lytic murein transglycosylase B
MPPDFDPDVPGNFESKSVEEWQRIGVMPLAGTFPPDNRLSASIIRPDGTEGRSFLVYNNYQALLIWNRSDYFAIGVGLFADQLELANKE